MALTPRNTRTDTQLLDEFPSDRLKGRGANESDDGPVGYQAMVDLIATLRGQIIASKSGVVDAGSLQTDDGTTSLTTTEYYIKYTKGTVRLDGTAKHFAAADDQDLFDEITSYDLAGDAAVALTADGKTYWVALVAVLVSDAIVLRAIFGDEADDTEEVAVTDAQIKTALEASADAEDLTDTVFVRVADIKIQRVATDTITMTHTNVETDNTLSTRRHTGTVWNAVS